MKQEDIRARLQSLANQTSKRKDLWKPKDNHLIRLLPYPHGDEPFIELGFHYELGKTRAVLCPNYNDGEECPICDFAAKLKSWNDEDGNEKPKSTREADWEIFKKIQVKSRYYVAMVERDVNDDEKNPDSEPKFWAFGKMIFERLLTLCLNDEMNEAAHSRGTGVFVDPEGAYDLRIDFKQANNKDGKGNDKRFPVTTVELGKLAPLKLAKTKKKVEEILAKIPNMEEVYPKTSTKEVNKIFMDFVNSGELPEDDSGSGTEYKANSAEKPVEGTQSIDAAFGKLAGE